MNGVLKNKASFAVTMLASIFLSFSYATVSDAGERENTCPSKNFSVFLLEFSAKAETQKRFALDDLQVMVLKQKGDTEQVEPNITHLSSSALKFPIIVPISSFKEEGIKVVRVDEETLQVVDKRAGDSEIKTYTFKLGECWALYGIEDWAITSENFKPPQKIDMSESESYLFQKAMAYSWLGWAQKYPLTTEIFQASLDNFVLAASEGNPEASLAAAGLSLSGMAPKLDEEKLESLYKAAARTLPAGAEGLSYVYCYGNDIAGNGPCKDPSRAEQSLIDSARLGSADGANTVGEYFETGKLVTKNINRAIACYQLAAQRGNSDAINNLERIKQREAAIPQPSYCY
ncbi:tetratricopeptide repeat protein [Pseudomonas frederiksbergensis]|uniref:tetratricopeptide repeat protein n=1 Tax=Pseudomonas frederiksbergensis TaxID=104087 RepID=UPI003D21B82C